MSYILILTVKGLVQSVKTFGLAQQKLVIRIAEKMELSEDDAVYIFLTERFDQQANSIYYRCGEETLGEGMGLTD
jgi:hypothetical protein